MRNFIDSKMHEIFDDFDSSLQQQECYCILKDVRFNSKNVPDYANPFIQQLYLLRYFPAYMVEYYDMYRDIRKLKFIKSAFNVLSIGAGSGVDYIGLNFTYEDEGKPIAEYVYYTGLDRITWGYRETFDNPDCRYIDKDIRDLSAFDDNHNVIMFPKSIGEFGRGSYLKLLKLFSSTKFSEKRVILASSVREQNDSVDVSRLAEIADILENVHGYNCLDNKRGYTHYTEDVGLKAHFNDFDYPPDVLQYITSLSSRCPVYLDNGGKSCKHDCSWMNRWPILKTGHIKYQILRLQR